LSQAIPAITAFEATPPQSLGARGASDADRDAFRQAMGQAERRSDTSSNTRRGGAVNRSHAHRPDQSTKRPEAVAASRPDAEQPKETETDAPTKAGSASDAQSSSNTQKETESKTPPAAQPQAPVLATPAVQADAAAALQASLLASTPVAVNSAPQGGGGGKATGAVTKLPDAGDAPGKAGVKPQDPMAGLLPGVLDGQAPTKEDASSTGGDSSDAKDQPAKDLPGKDKLPKVTKSPVASQKVAQSIDSQRESAIMTKIQPPNGATDAPLAAKPGDKAADPTPEAPDTKNDLPKGEEVGVNAAVKPWELPQQVGAPAGGVHARVLDQGVPKGEPAPMHEVIKTPFVQAATENRPTELRLQLSPEHLGKMEVRVFAHEGAVSAQIRVESADTKNIMQGQLDHLRQTLADQGIKIDKLEVSVGQDKDQQKGQGFDLSGGMQQPNQQQQQQTPQQSEFQRRIQHYQGYSGYDEVPEEGETAPSHAAHGGSALVDARA
jgi:flagellar hook-length control protein FliK